LDNAGFKASVDVSKISGDYEIGLGFIDGKNLKVCSQFNVSARFYGINNND
jgi:hypothetical protein